MFMWHHITPREFYAKSEGEQKLLHAFTAYEIKHRIERRNESDKVWAEFLAKIHGAKIG